MDYIDVSFSYSNFRVYISEYSLDFSVGISYFIEYTYKVEIKKIQFLQNYSKFKIILSPHIRCLC